MQCLRELLTRPHEIEQLYLVCLISFLSDPLGVSIKFLARLTNVAVDRLSFPVKNGRYEQIVQGVCNHFIVGRRTPNCRRFK